MKDLLKFMAIQTLMFLIVYCGVIVVMIWGWGLRPVSWLVIVGGYVVIWFTQMPLRYLARAIVMSMATPVMDEDLERALIFDDPDDGGE